MRVVLLPIVIIVWAGFLGMLGFFLSAQLLRANMKRRVQEALAVNEDDLEDDDVAKAATR